MSSLTLGTQFNGSSILTQSSRSSSMLALRPTQQQQNFEFPELGQSTQSSGLNPFDDWSRRQENRGGVDDYLMEEIRARSHEILENDEMQQMLRILSMGGASASLNNADGFPSYMPPPAPAFSFEDDRTRPSGKAVVGWLKIKAAMRWGIFVRRKAAERRAQLVELEDWLMPGSVFSLFMRWSSRYCNVVTNSPCTISPFIREDNHDPTFPDELTLVV